MVLPYIAVVLANAGASGAQQAISVLPQVRAIEAPSSARS
jgi:hypothetical protein